MKLDAHISSMNSMNSVMKRMGRMLIANEQGRNFVCLSVAPRQPKRVRILAALVIHATIVFTAKSGLANLLPFVNILQSPGMLRVHHAASRPFVCLN